MPQINKSIEIAAPRERVFAEATDPAKQSEWAIFFKDVQVQGDGRAVGARQRWSFKVGPRAESMEAVVTKSHENESIARQTEGSMGLSDSMNFIVVEQDITRMHWSFEYEPPMGAIGKLLDVVLINRVFQNDIETSLENLKRRLEG